MDLRIEEFQNSDIWKGLQVNLKTANIGRDLPHSSNNRVQGADCKKGVMRMEKSNSFWETSKLTCVCVCVCLPNSQEKLLEVASKFSKLGTKEMGETIKKKKKWNRV